MQLRASLREWECNFPVSVTLTIDTRPMQTALQAYYPTTQKSLNDIINQRMLNIVGRAFDAIPPADPDAKRSLIKQYLREQVSQKIRLTKSSRRFVKSGVKNNQLQRVHLIVQARRAKAGKKGLWGPAMRVASGNLARKAQDSVGFVKSVFIPIIRTLNPLVQYKFPFSKTAHISRWPGSAGSGFATPAHMLTWNPTARIEVEFKVKRNDAGVQAILENAVQLGFDHEAVELMAHVQKKMQEDANRINARAA